MNWTKTWVALAVAALCGPAVQAQQDGAVQAVRPVTITGSTIDDRFGDNAREPTSTTVITGKQIEEQHAESLADVLKAVPGVTLDTAGGDELKIKFRGVENQRYMGEKPGVAIVIDGVPVFERTGKVNIDIDNIESIKIIKGGASYLFGEDALSGAVIITTKRGATNKGVTLETDAGAFGYMRNLARVGGAGNNWSAHLQASRRKSDGWHFQSDYQAEALTGNVKWMPNNHSDLTFGFEKEKRYRDKHGTVRGVTQALQDPKGTEGRDFARHFNVDLQRLNLTYSNDLSETSNLLASVYQHTDHTVFWSGPVRYALSGKEVTDMNAYSTLNDYRQTQRGLKAEYRHAFGPVGLMAGGEIKRNSYKNNTSANSDYCSRINSKTQKCTSPVVAGTISGDDLTRENVEALYGELKWTPAENWELTGNARHDRIRLAYSENPVPGKAAPPSYEGCSFHANSFRLGLAWSGLKDTTLFGNISTGFRVPTADQLYRGSTNLNGRVDGNPNLKPERATNYELGIRKAFTLMDRDASVQATVFQIDRKDFILDTNGQYGSSQGGLASRYENVGGARSRGLELALKASFTPTWDADVSYTWLDSYFTRYDRFVQALGNTYAAPCTGANPAGATCSRLVVHNNTGNKIPRTPPHALNLRTSWRFAEGWKLSGEMDYRATSFADETNQEKWPGRTVFNLGLDYSRKLPWMGGAQLSAFVKVDNVFKRRYYTIARGTNDSNNDGRYNAEDLSITVDPGRVWRMGLAIRF